VDQGFNIAAAGRREAAHKKSDAGSRCPAVLTFDALPASGLLERMTSRAGAAKRSSSNARRNMCNKSKER